jgi:hypothetical protein
MRTFILLLVTLPALVSCAPAAVAADGGPSPAKAPVNEQTTDIGRARFALPKGWTVAATEGDTAVLALGPKKRAAKDAPPEALVVVASQELEAADTKKGAAAFLKGELGSLLSDLRAQGVEIPGKRPRPTAVAGARTDAAEVTLTGTSGEREAVTIWIGTAKNSTHAACVLVLTRLGHEERWVTPARALLATLELTPPPPVDAKTAATLVGLEFGRETFGSDSSLTTVYSFGANGRLVRRTMFSSPMHSYGDEDSGSYTVTEDGVTLRVEGEVVRAKLVRESGRITALAVGTATYRRV